MNREIKFRGRTPDGKWLYGDLLRVAGGTLIYYGSPVEAETHELEGVGVALMSNEIAVVVPETVGQFTGLRDRSGKDIYEGDILICTSQRKYTNGHEYFRKVMFKNGSFCMSVLEYNSDSTLYSHAVNGKLNWEVIGNIHDNPELMEGGAE